MATLPRTLRVLPAFLLALFPALARAQLVCTRLEDCDNGVRCYVTYGYKWCGSPDVNVYNHTPYQGVVDSWAAWNHPPNGPTSAIHLATDGINNSNHDVDYWTTQSSSWWWGWSSWGTSNGCFNRGGGMVQFNTSKIPPSYYAELLTSSHETGHQIGLGHACICSQVMDPCFNCSSDQLSSCDAQGAAAIYPGSSCTAIQQDCPTGGGCCAGLSCQPWVLNVGDPVKDVCCDELGQACRTIDDCCGGLNCTGGVCACQPPGKFCLRDVDCCGDGFCVNQKCGPSALPNQPTGNSALSMVNWPTDGHAELFATTPGQDLVHLFSAGATDSWDALNAGATLGTGSLCGAAAAFWLPNLSLDDYAELFSLTAAGATQHLFWNPSSRAWSPFGSLGGSGATGLTTLAWPDGHVEIFALGSDHGIWHDYYQFAAHAWSGWESLGGSFATSVGAIVWGDGHGEIFATDASGSAWHDGSGKGAGYPGGWSGWQKLSGQLATRPLPVRWADGHIELFARGIDGQLYQSDFTSGAWPVFAPAVAGTNLLGEPSPIMNPAGAGGSVGPEIFARDAQGLVGHSWWTGSGFAPWTPFAQPSASDPFGWSWVDGHTEIFAIDLAGNLVRSARSASGSWASWSSLGSGLDPCAVQKSPSGGTTGGSTTTGGGTTGGAGTTGGSTTTGGSGSTGGGTTGGTTGGASTSGTGGSSPAGDGGEVTRTVRSGCGCQEAPDAEFGLGLGLSLLALARRRRRPPTRGIGRTPPVRAQP